MFLDTDPFKGSSNIFFSFQTIKPPEVIDYHDLKCLKCHKVFANRISFVIHNQRSICERKKIATSVFENLNLKSRIKASSANKETHLCPVCGKSCINLDLHIKGTHGSKEYLCDICDFSASRYSSIYLHITNQHLTRDKMCETCGKGFTHERQLKKHMRSHVYDYPFECNECDRSYKNPESLSVHKLYKHKKVKKECAWCFRLFNSYTAWYCHMQSEHKGPHQCEKCGKEYRTLKYFKTHSCEPKNIPITAKENMQYSCEVCGWKTTAEVYLEQHMVKHTRKKPYKCQGCCAEFGWKSSYYNHLKSVHRLTMVNGVWENNQIQLYYNEY